MGITVNDFFENIYSVIFSPKAFFEREDVTVSIRLAVVTVVFIALINKLTLGIFDGSILSLMFIFSLFYSIISTVFIWFLTALFFEYIARIFDRGKKLEKILFLTAFVPVPYIFFAPLNLIKQISDNKVYYLENNLKEAKTKEEIEAALLLIDEEYYDLIENINFEVEYVCHQELSSSNSKKIQKAHKKFMRQLKRNNLKLLR